MIIKAHLTAFKIQNLFNLNNERDFITFERSSLTANSSAISRANIEKVIYLLEGIVEGVKDISLP